MPADHCRANAKTLWEWLDCKLRENYIGKEKICADLTSFGFESNATRSVFNGA